MKIGKGVRRAALCTAVLAALAAAGFLWFPEMLKPYDEVDLLRRKPAPYQGVLRVWQVNDWRVGAYSRTALLQAAAKKFEKANIGIFVEVENVTEQLYAQRVAAGILPDILSFPDGWAGISADGLLNLDVESTPPLEDPFRRAFAAEPRAVPWMAGGQLILTNNGVGRAVGVEPPQADGTWTAQALLDWSASAATGRRKKPVIALAGATALFEALALEGVGLDALEDKGLLPAGAYGMGIDAARQVYSSGKCAALLCSQWEAALMGRLAAKNKAFDYTVLPWPGGLRPCLAVQFAAALTSGDPVKDAAEIAFVQSLLTIPMQKDVANKACSLPVIALPAEALPQGELEKLLLAELAVARMPLPLVLRDAAAVEAALGGDGEALQKVRQRFVN